MDPTARISIAQRIRSFMWSPDWLRGVYFFFERIGRHLGWVCYCGSGAHPRRCNKHPWGHYLHKAGMDHDALSDYVDELEERIKRLEALAPKEL